MSEAIRLDDWREWTPEAMWRRFEILGGSLLVSPPAVSRHELVVSRIIRGVEPPPSFQIIGSVGVRLGRSYLIPDVTVLADRAFSGDRSVVSPADVLLAVEVESASSISADRILKPAHYAAAGIRHYWRVEIDPLVLRTYRLVDGAYVEIRSWTAGEIAHMSEPLVATIDLSGLSDGVTQGSRTATLGP